MSRYHRAWTMFRTARAPGEFLGETVTAYRSLGFEDAEGVVREGFTGPHHRHGVYVTTDRDRAAFYARFMGEHGHGVMFEVEMDASRTDVDPNDTIQEQNEALESGWSWAASKMESSIRDAGGTDATKLYGLADLIQNWLSGGDYAEQYHSVWQLIADNTDLDIPAARQAVPPGRYGEFVLIDNRGVAGIHEDNPTLQMVYRKELPPERVKAAYLPTDMLDAVGVEWAKYKSGVPKDGFGETVNIIPGTVGDLIDEVESQIEALGPEDDFDDDTEQLHDEMTDIRNHLYEAAQTEEGLYLNPAVFRKLNQKEKVELSDFDYRGGYVRFNLPADKYKVIKILRTFGSISGLSTAASRKS